MAGLAGSGKLCADVVRVRGLLVVIQMTGCASRGKPLELADGRTLVAILALHSGVSPQEREAILVILNCLDGNVPAENGVTLGAIRAHLALVNVGMTVLTLLARVRKDRLDMALGAFHFFVHSAERILGLVVIKFRNWPDGSPTCGRVAILTGYSKRAVRASRCHTLSEGRRNRGELAGN
jgi:hypothetical protein